MFPEPIQKLIELFQKLPGIGPRQATRFAFFAISEHDNFASNLSAALRIAAEEIGSCAQCFRATEKNETMLCRLCRDSKRDALCIAVVEKESDLQNLEKTGSFLGLYHVLGGVVSPLDAHSPKRLHLKALYERVGAILKKSHCEIILATNPTAEGDTTALYIERILLPLKEYFPELTISRLGRGLSLGSELEYADEITLKNAFKNRT